MDYAKRWEIQKILGAGGQGTVHLVTERTPIASYETVRLALMNMVKSVAYEGTREQEYRQFRSCMRELIQADDPFRQGALKVLHKGESARDPDLAKERIAREIKVMSETQHPNLMQLLDVDSESEWYVSRYYANGTLADNPNRFKGDLHAALRAIRPLVEAVACLHRSGYVHRDIKPHNVFIGYDDELILGDFGLIHFADSAHTRISCTYENVGSRDWMPGWAMGMRIDQVRPTFDVFALGKLLWSMVSGRPILQLWYFDKPQFDLVGMFPESPHMKLANRLFKQCIVEDEDACLPDAGTLLTQVDTALSIIECKASIFGKGIRRRCTTCGIGEYIPISDGRIDSTRNFGVNPAGARRMKVFSCAHCGHVQLFTYDGDSELPPAWREE